MSRVEIAGTGLPGGTQIRLDGQDIADAVRGLTLTLGVNQVPRLELDIPYVEATRLDLEGVEVLLPTATHQLLVRHGWTPPQESTPEPAGSES